MKWKQKTISFKKGESATLDDIEVIFWELPTESGFKGDKNISQFSEDCKVTIKIKEK